MARDTALFSLMRARRADEALRRRAGLHIVTDAEVEAGIHDMRTMIRNAEERRDAAWRQVMAEVSPSAGRLTGAIERFDECVIGRGAGMTDRLNIHQQAIHAAYSDLEKVWEPGNHAPVEAVRLMALSRENGYFAYRSSGRYDDLLAIVSNNRPDLFELIADALEIDRGSRPITEVTARVRRELLTVFESASAREPLDYAKIANRAMVNFQQRNDAEAVEFMTVYQGKPGFGKWAKLKIEAERKKTAKFGGT